MNNTINVLKNRILKLSDRKSLQDLEVSFVNKYRFTLVILFTIVMAFAFTIFFFTDYLTIEIAIAGLFSFVLLIATYIKPSIKRMTLLVLSTLPVLFLVNLYGHVDYSSYYPELINTETADVSSATNETSILTDATLSDGNSVTSDGNSAAFGKNQQEERIVFSNHETIYSMSLKIVSEYLTHKYDWIAIIIAMFSLIFAIYTWKSQEKTQQNTQRITPEVQKGIMKDIFRHSYRNLIVLAAMKHKLELQGYDKYYPADYHLLKLRTDENSIYPETFVSNDDFCARMHEFKLIVRNGNLEIDTIKELLKSNKLNIATKRRDVGMINSRIDLIVQNTSSLIRRIYNLSETELADEVRKYFEEGTQKSAKAEEKEKKISNAMRDKESVLSHVYVRAWEDAMADKGNHIDNVYCEALVDVLYPPMKGKDGKKEKEYDDHTLRNIDSFITRMNAEVHLMLDDIDLINC